MNELKALCAASGISLHEQPFPYKHAWLYWPEIKSVIVFANASTLQLKHLRLLIKEGGEIK